MVRIGEIRSGSIAEALELRIGTRIVTVNGERVRDGLDFAFLSAEPELEMEAVDPDGNPVVYEIALDPAENLGIVPAPDKVRECANECVFCFIDGNPPGAREPLWLRDDDFRLSFTYGSYVTLTNVGPRGLGRLIEQRISPLYVSVHATDPETRIRLLKNERAGLILEQLGELLDAGLQVHTQVVLCPDWNDGEQLDQTIDDLYRMGEGVLSLSVVPVGLTRYNMNRPVRPLTAAEASSAIRQVDRIRSVAALERSHSWCYAADELFLIAGRPLPDADYYDDWPLVENGVGAVRTFVDSFEARKRTLLPIPGVERLRVVTGRSMAPFFLSFLPALQGALSCSAEVVQVENGYFGPSVTIAGLLSGEDVLAAVSAPEPGDLILLPGEALNDDGVFIDGLALTEVEKRLAPARTRAGRDLVDTLLRP